MTTWTCHESFSSDSWEISWIFHQSSSPKNLRSSVSPGFPKNLPVAHEGLGVTLSSKLCRHQVLHHAYRFCEIAVRILTLLLVAEALRSGSTSYSGSYGWGKLMMVNHRQLNYL